MILCTGEEGLLLAWSAHFVGMTDGDIYLEVTETRSALGPAKVVLADPGLKVVIDDTQVHVGENLSPALALTLLPSRSKVNYCWFMAVGARGAASTRSPW